MNVDLPMDDWNKILAILSQAPWREANPLIMQIGGQLQAAAQPPEGAGRGPIVVNQGPPNGADRNP